VAKVGEKNQIDKYLETEGVVYMRQHKEIMLFLDGNKIINNEDS
jgi:hypothetical protein